MIYDKTKPPFTDSVIEWEDFCDFMNKEGIYANPEPGKIRYCKNYFFITTNEGSPNIECLNDSEKLDINVSWFDHKIKQLSKLPAFYFNNMKHEEINKR